MKRIFFVLTIAILISLTGIGVAGTVRAQEKPEIAEKEQFYREQERQLLKCTGEQMERMGFYHCGITLNRVVERETERKYTFTIHHKKIDRMDAKEKENLAEELEKLAEDFGVAEPGDVCTFQYAFFTLQ